jgi:outer membrane lipoprotein-sorting protein
MKKLLLATTVMLSIVFVGCNSTSENSAKDETAESIVSKIHKATDVSGERESINSALLVYNSGTGDKDESEVTLKIRKDGKFRLEVRRDNKLMVKAYDGKSGWEYTTDKGLRVLEGNELNELKFQSVYMVPDFDFYRLFAKVELAGDKKVAGVDCWELVCTPKAEFESQPVIICVNKSNYLITKTIEQLDVKDKVVEIVTFLGDYENIDGIMTAQLMISQIDNSKLAEVKLVKAEWNVKFADSEFAEPLALSRTK